MKKIILLTGSLLLTNNALAYIDPGTGVAVAGSLWPMLVAGLSAALAFLIKIFWTPIKNAFLKIKKKLKR
ncbi:MAG: hypothetical protein GON13_02105 [Nanoarchaeota archaeon]|nr:hypothetical protein [Nanoarchaeota archaeon]